MIMKIAHLLAVSSMYPSIAKKKNLQIIDPKQQLTNDAKNCLERSFREALKKLVKIQDLFINRLPPLPTGTFRTFLVILR